MKSIVASSIMLLASILMGVASAHFRLEKLTKRAPDSDDEDSGDEFSDVEIDLSNGYIKEVLAPGDMHATDVYLEKNKVWAAKQDTKSLSETKDGQSPNALWVSCSDSRLNPERVMDTAVGEIFVHRNVGNIIYADDDDALSWLEYGMKALNVEHVMVVGHYECGAVHAVLNEEHGFDNLDRWLQQIRDVHTSNKDEFHGLDEEEQWRRLVELNALQSGHIINANPHVQKARKDGKDVFIHVLVYDIGSGLLHELDVFDQ